MMKKILRLLLLGFLTVTVLSPSVVTAEEDQSTKEPSSSVYNEIDGYSPLAIPYREEFTLNNGESFYKEFKFIIFPNRETKITRSLERTDLSTHAFWSTQIFSTASLNGRTSYPLVLRALGPEQFHTAGGIGATDFFYDSDLTEPMVHTYAYKVTNYEAGPLSFRLTINIDHGNG